MRRHIQRTHRNGRRHRRGRGGIRRGALLLLRGGMRKATTCRLFWILQQGALEIFQIFFTFVRHPLFVMVGGGGTPTGTPLREPRRRRGGGRWWGSRTRRPDTSRNGKVGRGVGFSFSKRSATYRRGGGVGWRRRRSSPCTLRFHGPSYRWLFPAILRVLRVPHMR